MEFHCCCGVHISTVSLQSIVKSIFSIGVVDFQFGSIRSRSKSKVKILEFCYRALNTNVFNRVRLPGGLHVTTYEPVQTFSLGEDPPPSFHCESILMLQ